MTGAVITTTVGRTTNTPVCTAVYLGDVVSDKVALLALVPEEALLGAQVRAVHLLAAERLFQDTQDYRVLQLGTLRTGTLKLLGREIPLSGGLEAGVCVKYPYTSPLLVARGDIFAARFTSHGAPPPIAGLSVICEWGILSTDRASTGAR